MLLSFGNRPKRLAEAAGVHVTNVYKWLDGTSQPGFETLDRLVRATGCSREALQSGDGPLFAFGPRMTQLRVECQRRSGEHGSPADFARKVGVEAETYEAWEQGRAVPTPADLARVAEAASARVEYLMTGDPPIFRHAPPHGDAPAYPVAETAEGMCAPLAPVVSRAGLNHDRPQPVVHGLLPLYGEIPAGAPVDVQQAHETCAVLAHLARPGRYVLRVLGDSMSPEIKPDDLVLIEHVEGRDLREYDNRICAVLLDGQSTLKRVLVKQRHGATRIILRGDRPGYPEESFLLGERDFAIQGVALKVLDRDLT